MSYSNCFNETLFKYDFKYISTWKISIIAVLLLVVEILSSCQSSVLCSWSHQIIFRSECHVEI